MSTSERWKRAEALLDEFAQFGAEPRGNRNEYLLWLRQADSISSEKALRFLCIWYSVSRHQPQMLLHVAAAFHAWEERKGIMANYIEEDGQAKAGDDPHYVLLQQLIEKMGGTLVIDPESERMASGFRESIGHLRETEAAGLLAGIEHPALDISSMLHEIINRAGFGDLLDSDPYLTIHVDVEPDHIIDAHGRALSYLQLGAEEEAQVVVGFRKAMKFWAGFWPVAFRALGYGNFAPVPDGLTSYVNRVPRGERNEGAESCRVAIPERR